MTSPPRTLPVVTPLQSAYLAVLTDGPLTGKEMRAELSYCGWHRRKAAFFRVIQTLKQANLIDATRIPREEEEYRGAQCVYELTQEGKNAAAVMRALYTRAEKRQRLRRWRGKRPKALTRRFNQRAERSRCQRVSAYRTTTYSPDA